LSRTDKDKPWWLGDRFRADHYIGCSIGRDPCDLPEKYLPYHRMRSRCTWEAVHHNGRYWWNAPPPKWYTDHHWQNPQRVQERDRSRKMIAEYRGSKEVETEIPSFQHRHGAAWDYW